ncbi:MAG: hypothetical protein QM751_12860 [Paludibacteraceae bacterium]
MSTTRETGHKVNIENLDQMIVSLKGLGEAYNPSNEDITISSLEQKLIDARAFALNLSDVKQPYTAATDARQLAFESLEPKVTRAFNALQSTKTSAQTDESAKAIVRKIKGQKAALKKTAGTSASETGAQVENNQISSAQLGYDDLLQNFDEFIKLLEITPQYTPNEMDLKIRSLKEYKADLTSKNHAVIDTKVAVSNARIARNEVLYQPLIGVVDTATDVKNYVKSVFGAKSPQFRQISGLVFRRPKK